MVEPEVGIMFGDKHSYVYVKPPIDQDETMLLLNRGAIEFGWLLQSGVKDPTESLIKVESEVPKHPSHDLIFDVAMAVYMTPAEVRRGIAFNSGILHPSEEAY
jgi:hypothetical protein